MICIVMKIRKSTTCANLLSYETSTRDKDAALSLYILVHRLCLTAASRSGPLDWLYSTVKVSCLGGAGRPHEWPPPKSPPHPQIKGEIKQTLREKQAARPKTVDCPDVLLLDSGQISV